MATTSKLSFRARNLDANRGMKVFFADELPDISECAPIARGVNPMPTGMEKEEEMETHLQDAIHAQQASTSGISDNHVIPTPKVLYIDDARYDMVYPVQPPCKAQLMKVQAWLSMEREEAEYDMDSEDEDYLRSKPHINSRDLERIMEQLEAQSSESAICQPATARKVLMPHFDDNVIDDVYDYWLSKRKEAATNKTLGFGGLIPRIRTECRKENEKLNPYVAFRRRAEKMQTRKNRKNDEDSYEKVLRLGHDLRRAVHLFEMVKRREKSKLAMLDLDAEILTTRAQLGDYGSVVYNQILAKLHPDDQAEQQQELLPETASPLRGLPTGASPASASDPALQPLRGDENGVKRKKNIRKRVVTGLRSGIMSANFDRDLPNKAWLKKNAEVWNQSPTAFISGMHNYSPAVEQVDQSVAAAHTANADGRYAFKRRRGCHYRPAAPLREKNGALPSLDSIPPERRFYYVSMPSTSRAAAPDATTTNESTKSAPAAPAQKSLLRRRIGRGGRVVFDLFPVQQQPVAAAARRLQQAAVPPPPPVPPVAAPAPQRTTNTTTSSNSAYVAGRRNTVIYDPFELDCAAMGDEESSQWEARPRHPVEDDEEEPTDSLYPVSSLYLHSARHRCAWSAEDEEADAAAEAAWLASAVSPSPSPQPREQHVIMEEDDERQQHQQQQAPSTQPPPAKRRPPPSPTSRPSESTGPSPPSEHEDSTTASRTAITKSSAADDRLTDVIDYTAKNGGSGGGANGANGARIRLVQQLSIPASNLSNEESAMEEDCNGEGGPPSGQPSSSCSAADSPAAFAISVAGNMAGTSTIEDSPTSSSEQDSNHPPILVDPARLHHHQLHNHTANHTNNTTHLLHPLGEGAVAVHHLHLASGNASVLSPPDSTAPSPRVSNGSGSGVTGGAGSTVAAAATAPHSNGHNGHAGSGNGVVASGYEAADADATQGPDAWRMRAKLVTMAEAVASRLNRVKDPDASSRESGCSPTEKSLPSPGVVVDADGVVVQLVEPWREPSNSPSESNSSSDWTPPASTRTSGDVDARLTTYATLSSEEETGARTGDHPSMPAKPTRKSNGASTVQQMGGGMGRSSFASLATTTPSPVV